jgi:hypothetical protein
LEHNIKVIETGSIMKTLTSCLILAFAINQIALAQVVSHPGSGSAGGWRLIGTTRARSTEDHDGIIVQGPYNNFTRVKFKVTNAPLRMVKMVVTYDEGAPDNIEMLFDIPQGGESREIGLRDVGERKIRRIDFWYEAKGGANGNANVTVFEMK